jgi:transposase
LLIVGVVGHGVVVSQPPSYDQLAKLFAEVSAENAELRRVVAVQADRISQLEARLGADSSNSSRPPSSDSPWEKKPAPKRGSRTRSGRKPGKQPGGESSSLSLSANPNHTRTLVAHRCVGCDCALVDAEVVGTQRRQVLDQVPPPAPEVTEYRRIAKRCRCCGTVTTPDWDDPEVPERHRTVLAGPGSPVRIGPGILARAAFLTCAHYLPIGRARQVLAALGAMVVSTGLLAGVRGRAARGLEAVFLPHMQALLQQAPVLHADETVARAAGTLKYVHVACTEYLTLMHVGGRSAADIDAGGVLPEFTGVLVRDGYAGYTHLPALHAWCAAHLIRDLRSITDADPDGQLWATAMTTVLLDAHHAATRAREHGADRLDESVVVTIRNHYLGATALGVEENRATRGPLADKARTLIERFRRYEDMILRFATDLAVPFTNNCAERAVRPVKVQQRTSGGAWRTLQGLIDFAIVGSYLDTAHKWGIDKLHALDQLFTTGPWLPPSTQPS